MKKITIIFGPIIILIISFVCGILYGKYTSKHDHIDGYVPYFRANLAYKNISDIPEIIIGYDSILEEYKKDNVYISLDFGHAKCATEVFVEDGLNQVYHWYNNPFDIYKYCYQAYYLDSNNQKGELIVNDIDVSTFYLSNYKTDYYTGYFFPTMNITIKEELFEHDKGEIKIGFYSVEKSNFENNNLIGIISVKYEKNGDNINLIPPKNSFFAKEGVVK